MTPKDAEPLVLLLRSLVGRVETRVLAGAVGLTLDGTLFGIVAEGRLYYRTDYLNRTPYEDYDALSATPAEDDDAAEGFCPRGSLPRDLSFREVPPPVLNDAEVLRDWTQAAWEAGKRARQAGR